MTLNVLAMLDVPLKLNIDNLFGNHGEPSICRSVEVQP